ncbi:methyltransferase [uncultured Sphingomonas sp.]|uniref:class I SAM-dependent methyltransferase n=1 Tax=uncultured Sphingomonas sp. TaxID=158754 RepID=UPI0025E3E4C7|nr:methyltransferase [uncultured Sphingomonas sp.]
MRLLASAALLSFTALATPAVAQKGAISAAVANPDRPEAERARDRYRHPVETLTFFGVTPTQTVVEYSPGGGWYTRILMPLLADKGSYVAATSPRGPDGAKALVAKGPGAARAKVIAFDPAGTAELAPAAGADRVLTFRNVHNLLMAKDGGPDGAAPAFFAAAFKALKPGGVLGVVDHRLPENASAEREKTSGYVKRSTVVRLATAAGFTLAGESQVNANPKDSADWPKGVWTLPPTLQLGEQDRAKYVAIGESDRMTLRFVKPR